MISDKPLTPETTAAAAQIAGMFNSLHKFLDTLKHADAKGDLLMTEHMRNAHTKIEEASFWAVKHVLTFGMPKAPAARRCRPVRLRLTTTSRRTPPRRPPCCSPKAKINPAKVFILGYELGGYAAPRIAEADGKLAGIVLFAANERPIEDLFVNQAAATAKQGADYLVLAKTAAARIKKLDQGDADGAAALGLPVSYWLDLRSYDPGPLVKQFTGRVLVLAAERDFQVPMTDFEAWKKALAGRKDVVFKSYLSLNHLFMAGEGKEHRGTEYKKPGHVAADVIDDLAKFLTQ